MAPQKEGSEFRPLQRAWKVLVGRIGRVARLKTDVSLAESLEKETERLTVSEGELIEELKRLIRETKEFSSSLSARQRKNFGPVEVEWIESLRKAKEPIREKDSAWRVGPVEIELRRELARARALYNGEEIVRWSPVTAVADLEKLHKDALQCLKGAALPDNVLIEAIWSAYDNAARAWGHKRVPLPDLYCEFRVALFRSELSPKKPDKKSRFAEFPKWMFLYNFDRYRALGDAVPAPKRLQVETGSQQDNGRIGMRLNGLRADLEIKVLCYALPYKA